MNIQLFVIHLTITFFFTDVFTKKPPEATAIDSESEEDERSEDLEELHDTSRHGLKRNREAHPKKHKRKGRALDDRKQCAIMYKNEEPVGILQRFENSYQLLPVRSEDKIPVDISPMDKTSSEEVKQDTKRHTGDENLMEFSDEKYPTIFAKFKVDSRLEKEGSLKSRTLEKRASKPSNLLSEKHSDYLRLQSNDESAAGDLKGILNDMGLIDDPQAAKREVEDEDLEHGSNKITLLKIDRKSPRSKRGKPKEKSVTKHYAMIEIPEPKSINEDEYIDEYLSKHPEQAKQLDQEQREKRSEDMGKQMEQQIQERLNRIKEEVRNEIEQIKANGNPNLEEEEEEEANEEEDGKPQRKKRNIISNLMEEETSDLDPVLIGDSNPSPHIRIRRGLDGSIPAANTYQHQQPVPTADPLVVATTHPFSLRRLKEFPEQYRADEEVADVEDEQTIREKKACKCAGKDCKCGKVSASADESHLIYVDGAPLLMRNQERFARSSETNRKSQLSKALTDGGYTLDLDPEVYRIAEVDGRKKRSNFLDLVAVHGGGAVLDHLVSIRQRSMRAKRTAGDKEPLTLMDMSGEDLFGALPQGFDGELTRSKRVKRS
ncbi:probable inactive protein kinase DDB_G0270444 isoform X2 [Dendroctonus ponderosae]|uniref:probable inactive protein kinase DDB_G0270444 isoform X2 n=1 Tax=Dendroctonus ponderosae TaxID=77166 RepID=UPI00203608D2|nr:probable inactive protein kinase DDB_G0270444 isoform X2 [Dendroctonus ponderosae]XP_048518347.1 probable inactive protein kinase DDB_G0270444 isoform X2 [Dendroctonus ponderosae]